MVGTWIEGLLKVLCTHGLAVGVAVWASFVGLLVYLVALDATGLLVGAGVDVTSSPSLGSLADLASWLWLLV